MPASGSSCILMQIHLWARQYTRFCFLCYSYPLQFSRKHSHFLWLCLKILEKVQISWFPFCFFAKKKLFLSCQWLALLADTYWWKCFRLCPSMEMWKFSNQWTVEYAHSWFRLWLRARVVRTHILHIYSGVGYVSFILVKVFPQPPLR